VGLILGCSYVIGMDFKLGKDYVSAYPSANISMRDEVAVAKDGVSSGDSQPAQPMKGKYSFLDSELLHRRI